MSRVLERLRDGPLRMDDFAEVSASKGSLRKVIHYLRERGYDIASVELPNGRNQPRVEYHLNPHRCPACKQELVP